MPGTRYYRWKCDGCGATVESAGEGPPPGWTVVRWERVPRDGETVGEGGLESLCEKHPFTGIASVTPSKGDRGSRK